MNRFILNRDDIVIVRGTSTDETHGNPHHGGGGRFASDDEGGAGSAWSARVAKELKSARSGGHNVSAGSAATSKFPKATVDVVASARSAIEKAETADGKVTAKISACDPGSADVDVALGKSMTQVGAVGWYAAETDEITINAGLYESRADDHAANKEAERTGAGSSAHPDATLHHEIGHAQHFRSSGMKPGDYDRMYVSWATVTDLGGKSRDARKIARGVSKYAATQPHEFVAEVFAGVLGGKKYGPDVWDLYKLLNGPPLKGGRK